MTRMRFTCVECDYSVVVRGRNDDPRVKGPIRCPECKKGNFKRTLMGPLALDKGAITVDELMFLVAGLAMPGELITQEESVVSMLLANKIVDVEACSLIDRCVIESILLDNGVRLYFAASGMGAVVWRATREEKEHASVRDGSSNNDESVREAEGKEEHGPGDRESGASYSKLHRW